MLPLEALGPRIVIVGAIGSGKSTLATRLARHLDATVVHLDQLYHRPGTDWRPRPAHEFTQLHEYAINGQSWVMDGNYSALLTPRLERATGVIWLDMNRFACFGRYLKRSLIDRDRFGRLSGAADTVNWKMVRYILAVQPAMRPAIQAKIEAAALPLLRLGSIGQLQALCARWNI